MELSHCSTLFFPLLKEYRSLALALPIIGVEWFH